MLTDLGHPRARGKNSLDVTAFLESQKNWDLERDNGWTGVEFLFHYDYESVGLEEPSYKVPWMYYDGCVVLDLDNHPVNDYRDIPLTVSSKIEGELMEAIRRLDPRIAFRDFWARMSVFPSLLLSQQRLIKDRPERCGKGGILRIGALSERTTRARLRNCIPSKDERKGTKAIRAYIWSRMSPAARAANSTRELRKLSKEQQKQAKLANKGKHDMNAGGWLPSKKTRSCVQKEVLARRIAQEGVAKKRRPASTRSCKNRIVKPQQTTEPDFHGATESETGPPIFVATEQSHDNEGRSFCDSTLSALNTSQDSFLTAPRGYIPLDPALQSGSNDHDLSSFAPTSNTQENAPIERSILLPVSLVKTSHDARAVYRLRQKPPLSSCTTM